MYPSHGDSGNNHLEVKISIGTQKVLDYVGDSMIQDRLYDILHFVFLSCVSSLPCMSKYIGLVTLNNIILAYSMVYHRELPGKLYTSTSEVPDDTKTMSTSQSTPKSLVSRKRRTRRTEGWKQARRRLPRSTMVKMQLVWKTDLRIRDMELTLL